MGLFCGRHHFFSFSHYKVAQETGANFVPKTFPHCNSTQFCPVPRTRDLKMTNRRNHVWGARVLEFSSLELLNDEIIKEEVEGNQ